MGKYFQEQNLCGASRTVIKQHYGLVNLDVTRNTSTETRSLSSKPLSHLDAEPAHEDERSLGPAGDQVGSDQRLHTISDTLVGDAVLRQQVVRQEGWHGARVEGRVLCQQLHTLTLVPHQTTYLLFA